MNRANLVTTPGMSLQSSWSRLLHVLFTAAFSGTLAITTGCGPAASPGDVDGAGALQQKLPEQITKLLGASGAVAPGEPSVEPLLNADTSMNSPRAYPTATMLPNGKVLVVGGRNGTDSLSSAEIYDPQAHSWTEVASMSVPRSFHTATLINYAQVLVAGGQECDAEGCETLSSAEIYDPDTNTWADAASMSVARMRHTATSFYGYYVMVTGGINSDSMVDSSVEIYDPLSNAWIDLTPMSEPRYVHTATQLDDGNVLVTGYGANAETYDLGTNTWTTTGSMNAGRGGHTATLLDNGDVLVVGGGESSAEMYDPSSRSFSPVASMAYPRCGHTATLLDSSKVLVAGGEEVFDGSTAEIYDPQTDTWATGGLISPHGAFSTATRLQNGKVLLAGGWSIADGSALSNVDLYVPANTWTLTGEGITPRYAHAAVHLDDGVLVVGGADSADSADPDYERRAEWYDPATDAWAAVAPMNVQRAYLTATVLVDGKVLVAGGCTTCMTASSYQASAEVYDPSTDTWTPTGPMSAARAYHTATRLPDGKVLVVGGYDGSYGGAKLATADVYDPQTNAWTQAQSMSTGRIFHTATLLLNTGEVLVTGGHDDSAVLLSAEIYNPANNTWSSAPSMSVARAWHTATAFDDGRVLVVGGIDGPDSLSSAELYDPATTLWSDAGNMGDSRYGHSATWLDQDRVLVAGGTFSPYGALSLDTTAVYNLSTHTWTAGAPLRNARSGHTATPLSDGKVVVAGGWNWGWLGAEINTP